MSGFRSRICSFTANVSLPVTNITTPISCRDRCFKATKRSSMLECMCDHACMFLGDCCYDYLLECGSREWDKTAALHEQYSVYRRFHRYSSCENLHIGTNTPLTLKMVSTCSNTPHAGIEIESMCTNPAGKSTISSCVPEESDGILGPVLLTFLRHVARISANGITAFKESCSPIG